MNLLQKLKTIVKIINKNNFGQDNPLNLKQIFAYESLIYHYNELKSIFITLTTITRNKLLRPPKCSKVVSDKKHSHQNNTII